MKNEKENNLKKEVSLDEIASVIGESVKKVFGVIGLGNKKSFRDSISILLKKEVYKDGISVKMDNGQYIIDIYVILTYGVKISEVVNNLSSQVKYDLDKKIKIKSKSINIFVQDVKKI